MKTIIFIYFTIKITCFSLYFFVFPVLYEVLLLVLLKLNKLCWLQQVIPKGLYEIRIKSFSSFTLKDWRKIPFC